MAREDGGWYRLVSGRSTSSFLYVYPHPCTGAFTQACVWVCLCVCVCRCSDIIMYGMKDGSRGQLLYISGAGVLPQLSGTVDGAVAAAAAAGSSDVDYVFRVFMISPGFSGQLGWRCRHESSSIIITLMEKFEPMKVQHICNVTLHSLTAASHR